MDKNKTNVMRILEKNKITYEVFSYDNKDGKIDGKTVAEKIGFHFGKVYKTLVLQGNDRNYYVVVIPVDQEIDLKKAAKAFGIKKVELIPVAELNKITGYIRGGCSPIGMKKDFPILIEKSAESLEYILVSAGKIGVQIKINPLMLAKLRRAEFKELIR